MFDKIVKTNLSSCLKPVWKAIWTGQAKRQKSFDYPIAVTPTVRLLKTIDFVWQWFENGTKLPFVPGGWKAATIHRSISESKRFETGIWEKD